MNIDNDEILRYLPDKFRMQYYESIIKNGQVSKELLDEIISYYEEIYKKNINSEELLMSTFKNIDSNERTKLLELARENNKELFAKLSSNIYDFEDIVNLDAGMLKGIFEQFEVIDIIKASKAASPRINNFLQDMFPNIDFIKEKQALGMLQISEVMSIHNNIIEAINKKL